MDNDKLLSSLDKANPLIAMFENGLRPEVLIQAIRRTFEPYVKDPKFYEPDNLLLLAADWINFTKFSSDKWFFERFEDCLQLYNTAKAANEMATFQTIVDLLPAHASALSRFWSFLRSEPKFEELELADFVEENLRIIGQTLEGVSKTCIIELNILSSIADGTPITLAQGKRNDFGSMIDSLISKTKFADIFVTPIAHHLKINQWRNIAYHHNCEIRFGKIYCWYGKNSRTEFEIQRAELEEIRKFVVKVFNTLNISRTLFFYDNYNKLLPLCKASGHRYEVRAEAKLTTLYGTAGSQGFRVVKIKHSLELAELVLQDLIEGVIRKRALHATQFAYMLWYFTDAKILRVTYLAKDGTPVLRSTAISPICEAIGRGERGLEALAEEQQFEILAKTYWDSIEK